MNIGFAIWILKGFFEGIPKEVEEMALLQGCSKPLTFIKIVLPLARHGIAVAGIFSFMFSWNEFFYAILLGGVENRYDFHDTAELLHTSHSSMVETVRGGRHIHFAGINTGNTYYPVYAAWTDVGANELKTSWEKIVNQGPTESIRKKSKLVQNHLTKRRFEIGYL